VSWGWPIILLTDVNRLDSIFVLISSSSSPHQGCVWEGERSEPGQARPWRGLDERRTRKPQDTGRLLYQRSLRCENGFVDCV